MVQRFNIVRCSHHPNTNNMSWLCHLSHLSAYGIATIQFPRWQQFEMLLWWWSTNRRQRAWAYSHGIKCVIELMQTMQSNRAHNCFVFIWKYVGNISKKLIITTKFYCRRLTSLFCLRPKLKNNGQSNNFLPIEEVLAFSS